MSARASQLAVVAFDVLDYEPAEWKEVVEDIGVALLGEGLPGLRGGRWREHEGFFELPTASVDELRRVKAVLDSFAARVVVTPLEGETGRGHSPGTRYDRFWKGEEKDGYCETDYGSRTDQEVGGSPGRAPGAS